MSNPFGSSSEDKDNDSEDEDIHHNPDVHTRGAIHEKPLSAFISSVPPELCGPTEDFNPFQFWNKSSEEIDEWGSQISDAIQTAVNRHHRGFNQATTEFDEILSAFHDSEMKFKRVISNLSEARKLLHQSRGENGKTASIAKQWSAFESYKSKLLELDKIEYILEIPEMFEKYLRKKQFIHATVLLEDGLALYATSLSQESSIQLQSSMKMILNKKNDLEKLLRQQLYQQIYFKTNSLRSNLLRPNKKRNPNQNILNLLNFEEKEKEKDIHVLTSTSQPTSLDDPHKIIVPTYKSFRNLDDDKDDDIYHGNVEHLLVAETTDEYLKLASNNNNYSDDEQPLFLTICVTAIDKLGRSVGAKTHLFKSLDAELKEIIEREIYEVQNSFEQSMIQSNQMGNVIEAEDQSLMLLSATQNVFKMFIRVLSNHKTVINVFKQSEMAQRLIGGYPMDDVLTDTYTTQSVWNGIQKAILHNLLYKYLDKHLLKEKVKKQESTVDFLLNTVIENEEESSVRSVSPSPTPASVGNNDNTKSFGKRLKESKFFRRKNSRAIDIIDDGGDDDIEYNDLFASARISSKHHETAMDGLTFSFADSNIGSIVLDNEYRVNHHNKAMPSEFAAPQLRETKQRMSLSQHPTQLTAFSKSAHHKIERLPMSKSSSKPHKSIPKGRRRSLSLIEASPYHVTKLYKPIMHFVESAQLKVVSSVNDEYDLRRFLTDFVSDRFIPNMHAEAYYQMGKVLLDNQPMDQIRIIDEPLLLLKSSSGIFDLIKTLFEYYVVLPVFDSTQFVNMIQVILSKVRDTYQQAIDEISQILISRDIDTKYIKILNKYNLRKLFKDDNNKYDRDKYDGRAYEKIEENKKFDKFEYKKLHSEDDIIYFGELIKQNEDDIKTNYNFNTEYYSKLALISSGLFWMSKKITSSLRISKLSQFLSETFEPRSEKCISIIRMEMRSQTVCLLKNISQNNYWMKDDSIINKPQDFIITLNKLLVGAEAKLNGCLQPKLITYLFEELAYFICDIIIYQIPTVKNGKINHVGYKQLYKNTFSLQQNLTTITQKGMEKCFDRAQKYLKLSQKTPNDIKKIQDIKNKKYGKDKEKYAAYNFNKDQYDAISTVAKLSNAHRK